VAVYGHGNRADPLYEHARKWMAHDVNAVCEGAFSAGASRVLVKDAHGPGTNLLSHKIDERAELFTGWGPLGSMVEGLDSTFDGLMLVGYHSRAGTERGVLSHTFMGQIESLEIGGVEVGETGIAAAWAGHWEVPVILVAGDEAVTVEAEELLPGVTVCAVKRGLNRESAITLSRKERKRGETAGSRAEHGHQVEEGGRGRADELHSRGGKERAPDGGLLGLRYAGAFPGFPGSSSHCGAVSDLATPFRRPGCFGGSGKRCRFTSTRVRAAGKS